MCIALAACLFAFSGCDDKDSNPTSSSTPIYIGTWKYTFASLGTNYTSTYTITQDNKITTSTIAAATTIPAAQGSGTWAVTGTKFIVTFTDCKTINMAGTALESVSCGSADTLTVPTSSSWVIPDGNGSTITLVKQ